jgi:hypothetical protein
MKIVLIHYHLKTGGVTTVLQQQIAALRDVCDLLVLTGDRAAATLPCSVVQIPALGYDRPGEHPPSPARIAEQVLQVISKKWPGGCDVLHVHNPILAKNRQFLQLLHSLHQAGINLFLQVHDFAEDGRPDAYFEAAYPADCHYGVINRRDYRILRKAGLTPDGLHLIPNTVRPFIFDDTCRMKPQIVYPVRAIRRKNVGEAILLSLFFNRGQRLAITQPPNSPADAASYGDWVTWAQTNQLPIVFEAGRKENLATLLAVSESVITTSITEGFGLAFLEPWTAGKLLWGRRLDDICSDHESNGVDLQSLYDRIDVPLNWIDASDYHQRWHDAVAAAAKRYGHTFPAEAIRRAFSIATKGGIVDFGMLDETGQRQVLDRLLSDASTSDELVHLNPWLRHADDVRYASTLVDRNREAIRQQYGKARYRRQLQDIYGRVSTRPVRQQIDKRTLINAFLDLDRFPLLKWGAYER